MYYVSLAAACAAAFESGHRTLLSERRGEGDLTMSGEVVSQEVGEEERVARGGVDRRRDNATSVG